MSIDRCILGIDPGISGAIAFYFPGVPSRVCAEDVPVAAGSEVLGLLGEVAA
jgi:crossover junction endodeoxyribonuclease RuvC